MMFRNRAPKRPTYDCLCSHPLSLHERVDAGKFGPCNGLAKVPSTGSTDSYHENCRCLHYIGEIPPDEFLSLIGSA